MKLLLYILLVFQYCCVSLAQVSNHTKWTNLSTTPFSPWEGSSQCERYKCHLRLIVLNETLTHFQQANEICGYTHSSLYYSDHVSRGSVPWQWLESTFEQEAYYYCSKDCRFTSFIQYYILYLRMIRFSQRYWHITHCVQSHKNKCYVSARFQDITHYLCIVSLPTTIIFNAINFSILRKLLKNNPGAAIYFHGAEILTDVACNIIFSLERLQFFSTISEWYQGCSRLYELGNHSRCFTEFLLFMNQCFLMMVLYDRNLAIRKPFKYNAANHRKRALKSSLLIGLVAIVIFCPYYMMTTWYFEIFHLFGIWNPKSVIFVIYVLPIIISLFSWILLLAQVLLCFSFKRAWRKYKNGLKTETAQEKLKQEKTKNRLMFGTVGVNIVASSIFLSQRLSSSIWITRSDTSLASRYTDRIISKANQTLAVGVVFVNCSLGMLFHILFTKTYRKAFFETKIGKLLNKLKTGNHVQPQ